MDNVCVVRLTTEGYKKGDTYIYAKTLRVLKRLSSYNLLEDECQSISIVDGLENILNLTDVTDGKYFLEACNISRDCETGYIDDWDFKLIPYIEEDQQ